MKLWKKVLLAVTAIGMAGAAAASALVGGAVEVETVEVERRDIVQTVKDTGYVQPAREYNVYTAAGGRVVRVAVQTGQAVKEGETLLVLESLDLALQLNEMRTQLDQANATIAATEAGIARTELQLREARDNLARTEKLLEADAAPRMEYEQAQLLVETLEQNLKEQQAHLDGILAQAARLNQSLQRLTAQEQQLVVKSPAGGVVLSLLVKENQTLPPGYLVATVAPIDQLEVKADILSDDLPEITVGQKVTVTAPALGTEALAGEVRKIYPRAEEKHSPLGVTQRRVPVLISLEDRSVLKPGYEVTVAIETHRRENVAAVPRQAVRTTADGQKMVLAVVEGRIQHRLVETGISDGQYIEIVSGLETGEIVIGDGSLDLAENSRVKPIIFSN